jgi:hypothetical protein
MFPDRHGNSYMDSIGIQMDTAKNFHVQRIHLGVLDFQILNA